eukprot:TRINITY_DN2811_c0_g1_i8.p1 TRINITY_DN2811_c0_g1~~TRINITY_DN2811_c0_g1_i8.p1  ORF type:complete len:1391 (-),score=240.32 TRINITY_DN2811_c0_g1_i8:22-4194(-)
MGLTVGWRLSCRQRASASVAHTTRIWSRIHSTALGAHEDPAPVSHIAWCVWPLNSMNPAPQQAEELGEALTGRCSCSTAAETRAHSACASPLKYICPTTRHGNLVEMLPLLLLLGLASASAPVVGQIYFSGEAQAEWARVSAAVEQLHLPVSASPSSSACCGAGFIEFRGQTHHAIWETGAGSSWAPSAVLWILDQIRVVWATEAEALWRHESRQPTVSPIATTTHIERPTRRQVGDQRGPLLQFFAALNGPGWFNKTDWGSQQCHCSWFGVRCAAECDPGDSSAPCDPTCAVVALELPANNLEGRLPDGLREFSAMETLVLDFNFITGPLSPDLWGWDRLKALLLWENQLTGPLPELSAFVELDEVDLDGNRLSGSLPTALPPQLRTIWLGRNLLTGEIPPTLFSGESLITVDINRNELRGRLEDLVFGSRLGYLGFYSNLLGGPIPESLCARSRLVLLGLSANLLTGSLPECLSELPALQYLLVSDNPLYGPLPASFGNFRALLALQASNIGLTGTIPASLAQISTLEQLTLAKNYLTGGLPPNVTLWRKLRDLDLQENLFGGSLLLFLDPFFSEANQSGQSRRFSLNNLLLSKNFLTGPVPSFFGLYSLRTLKLNDNLLVGPLEEAYDRAELTFLDLSFNLEMEGCLPNSYGSFPFLLYLNVEATALTASVCSQEQLPEFLTFSDRLELDNPATALQCPSVISIDPFRQLTVLMDPDYYNYANCICASGWYGRDVRDCIKCPAECRCEDGIVSGCQPRNITNENGVVVKTIIEVCPYTSGSTTPCNPKLLPVFQCKEGTEDRLCSKCEPGYARVGDQCLKCSVAQSVVDVVAYFLFLCLLLLYVLRAPLKNSMMLSILVYYAQTLSILTRSGASWNPAILGWYSEVVTTANLSVGSLECLLPFQGRNSGEISLLIELLLTLLKPFWLAAVVFVVYEASIRSDRLAALIFVDENTRRASRHQSWSARLSSHGVAAGSQPAVLSSEDIGLPLSSGDIGTSQRRRSHNDIYNRCILAANYFFVFCFFDVTLVGFEALGCTIHSEGKVYLNTRPYIECSLGPGAGLYNGIFTLGALCIVYAVVVLAAIWNPEGAARTLTFIRNTKQEAPAEPARPPSWKLISNSVQEPLISITEDTYDPAGSTGTSLSPDASVPAPPGTQRIGVKWSPLPETVGRSHRLRPPRFAEDSDGDAELEEPIDLKNIKYGFVVEPFKTRYASWATVINLRRFFLAAALAFVPFDKPFYLFSAVFVVIFAALVLQHLASPFRNMRDNIYEALTLFCLLLTFFLTVNAANLLQSSGMDLWLQAVVFTGDSVLGAVMFGELVLNNVVRSVWRDPVVQSAPPGRRLTEFWLLLRRLAESTWQSLPNSKRAIVVAVGLFFLFFFVTFPFV